MKQMQRSNNNMHWQQPYVGRTELDYELEDVLVDMRNIPKWKYDGSKKNIKYTDDKNNCKVHERVAARIEAAILADRGTTQTKVWDTGVQQFEDSWTRVHELFVPWESNAGASLPSKTFTYTSRRAYLS